MTRPSVPLVEMREGVPHWLVPGTDRYERDEKLFSIWKARTMQPYYSAQGIEIYNQDCRAILAELVKKERPRLVLTDPPYGMDIGSRSGGTRTRLAKAGDDYYVLGDDEPFDPSHILAVFLPTILWGANYFADKLPPSSSWLTWDKKDGTTPDDNADCEYAWTNLGGPARIYRHLWRGMIKASEQNERRVHPTQKPVALMAWCLQRARIQPGDLVLDPYMGCGPVALACKALGARYIGVEIVEHYCAVAVRRLNDEFLPALVDNGAALDDLPLFAAQEAL